jgi:hypothetical protein
MVGGHSHVLYFVPTDASGVLEFVFNGHLSFFASLEIILGGCGIAVTVLAWLLTFVL